MPHFKSHTFANHSSREQARIDLEEILSFKFYENTEFILIDVPSCKGWGYDKNVLKGLRR